MIEKLKNQKAEILAVFYEEGAVEAVAREANAPSSDRLPMTFGLSQGR
jgi:hypothetical protein